MYLAQRYSDTAIQTDDTAGVWANIGKLWLPTEFEVMGAGVGNQSRFATMGSVQYPLFAHSMKRVIGRVTWWSMSTFSGDSTYFAYFRSFGYATSYHAASDYSGPVCFRISA